MKSETTEVLIKILRQQGKDIYKDTNKFKAMLLDYGISKKEINLLTEITKPEYFKVFAESIDRQNSDYEKVMLLNSVQDEYDFDEAYAIDGVKCWADALLETSGEPNAAKLKNAADTYNGIAQAAATTFDAQYESNSNGTAAKSSIKFEEIYNIVKNNYSSADTLFAKVVKIAADEITHNNSAASVQEKAKNGDSEARFLLGRMFETGDGVIQSFREAIKWYKMAAIIGNVNAIYRLGQIYEQGKIVPRNLDESIRWYKIAKEKGHNDGARKVKQLRKEKHWFF